LITIQKAKDWVREGVGPLRDALCLCDWQINYEFAACGDSTANGQCTFQENYRTAMIRLDTMKIDTRKECLEVLMHEMLHLILADFDVSIEACDAAVRPLGVPLTKALWSVHTHAEERAVGNLERMLLLGFGVTAEEIVDGGRYRKKGWIGR